MIRNNDENAFLGFSGQTLLLSLIFSVDILDFKVLKKEAQLNNIER